MLNRNQKLSKEPSFEVFCDSEDIINQSSGQTVDDILLELGIEKATIKNSASVNVNRKDSGVFHDCYTRLLEVEYFIKQYGNKMLQHV